MPPKTFANIAALTDVPVVIVDDESLVVEANDAFSAVFGWSRREIVGQPIMLFIPKRLRDAHLLGFSRFLATNRLKAAGRTMRVRAVAKDGREFEVELSMAAERRRGRWFFAASLSPLSVEVKRPSPLPSPPRGRGEGEAG